MVAVKMRKDVEKYLEYIARRRGKTPEAVASETLENWVENQALLALTKERKAEWEAGGRKTISWEDVKSENGL